MTSSPEYILGTDEAELRRLGLQHRLWSAEAYSAWERAGFGKGHTILDVGCGPGFATIDLALLVGEAGRVIAVDESDRYVEWLKARARLNGLSNVEATTGDVQRLGVATASVDGAYARWVMCFVANPEAVIAGVARALRPGGVFVVQDYFNYRAVTLAPRSEIFSKVIAATNTSWKMRGGDPDIASHLPGMMRRHGLRVREIRPHLRVARPGSLLWQWPETFFRNFIPRLIEMDLLSPGDLEAYERDWAARSADPDTFFSTPPVYDVIAERTE